MSLQLVPASYVLLLRGEPGTVQVLLHLRRGTGFMDGHWAALAGHVEEHESARAAAAREAYEEAGVRIEPVDLEPLTALHRTKPGAGPTEQRVDFFWTVRRWSGEPAIREPAKNAAMDWFALDALPEPCVPHEKRILDALAHGSAVPPILTDGS